MKSKELRVCTYNIDGLPDKLDLNTLPWVLRPVVWIYKLFKKTTVITINDNDDKQRDAVAVGAKLYLMKNDIIGVQEDFNYHDYLKGGVLSSHIFGKYTGGFFLDKIFSSVEIMSFFPLPRFKADGLNIIVNNERVRVNSERIIRWNKSNGYFDHANDLLTHKGFRHYNVTIDDEMPLDVYIVHMDADFYDGNYADIEDDVNARRAQMSQLTDYILERYKKDSNPSIIMGDFNSATKYIWDNENIESLLLNPINEVPYLHIDEAGTTDDVDRIFYINDDTSPWKLQCEATTVWDDKPRPSDHNPYSADFIITKV
jgi:hypothetical protein